MIHSLALLSFELVLVQLQNAQAWIFRTASDFTKCLARPKPWVAERRQLQPTGCWRSIREIGTRNGVGRGRPFFFEIRSSFASVWLLRRRGELAWEVCISSPLIRFPIESLTMRIVRINSLCHFVCVIAIALSSNIAMADTLDQVSEEGNLTYLVDSSLDLAQSFTVGLSGQLTQIDLFIGRDVATSSALQFDIRTLTGALPSEPDAGGNIFAAISSSAGTISTTDGWHSFDVSGAGLSVNAGDVFAIALRSDDAAGYRWNASDSGLYTDGANFLRIVNWVEDPFSRPVDLAFRSFVAVPEPSSLAILSVFAGLACVRRQRR